MIIRNWYHILSSVLLMILVAGCASSQSAEPESVAEEEPSQRGESAGTSDGRDEHGTQAEVAPETSKTMTMEVDLAEERACEPLSDGKRATNEDALTSEYKEFRQSARAQGAHRQSSDVQRDIYQVPGKYRGTCSSWLDLPVRESDDREFEGDCTVEFQQGGRVATIYQTTFCGGDACSIRYFVWNGSESSPVHVNLGSSFSYISAAPSADIVVFGVGVIPPGTRHTFRFDLESGDICRLSDQCFSPTVAPDGESVLCRNREGHVLAVPLDGGETTVLEKPDLDEAETVRIRPQWGEFPERVRFLEDGEVEYETFVEEKPTGAGTPEKRVETFTWPGSHPETK